MSALLLKGGRVIDPAAKLNQVCDVLIEDGIIQKVGLDIRADQAEVYDASDKIVVPGLIDMHTHLREPGQEAKEVLPRGLVQGLPAVIPQLRQCRILRLWLIQRRLSRACRNGRRMSP